MSLNQEPHFHQSGKQYFHPFSPGDDFYEMLIDAHRDLNDEESAMLNCKLILLLANHIGDISVLKAALGEAKVASDRD